MRFFPFSFPSTFGSDWVLYLGAEISLSIGVYAIEWFLLIWWAIALTWTTRFSNSIKQFLWNYFFPGCSLTFLCESGPLGVTLSSGHHFVTFSTCHHFITLSLSVQLSTLSLSVQASLCHSQYRYHTCSHSTAHITSDGIFSSTGL